MLSKPWLAVAALVCMPLAAAAQQHSDSPADPAAPAAPVAYQSAFKDYRTAHDVTGNDNNANTPDKLWRAANDLAGKLGGHAGQMKDRASARTASPDSGTPGVGGRHGKQH